MAQHGCGIARTQHCCQRARCKAEHSDPFVSGQNAGEPGTKRARHCCSVLVQRGIKYLMSCIGTSVSLCGPVAIKESSLITNSILFVSI